jgi:hypothetical protein
MKKKYREQEEDLLSERDKVKKER